MDSRRLFVSVDLPDSLTRPFRKVQSDFADLDGISPTNPRQAHVTLKFIGEVDEEDVDDVKDHLETAVADTGIAPFEAAVGGLGVFPSFDYISVIWVGVPTGASRLETLHEAVETELVEEGFDPDEHDFTPHITLARMDHAGPKERVQELVESQDPDVGEFTVDTVRLKESVLSPGGPTYETIHEVPLAENGDG